MNSKYSYATGSSNSLCPRMCHNWSDPRTKFQAKTNTCFWGHCYIDSTNFQRRASCVHQSRLSLCQTIKHLLKGININTVHLTAKPCMVQNYSIYSMRYFYWFSDSLNAFYIFHWSNKFVITLHCNMCIKITHLEGSLAVCIAEKLLQYNWLELLNRSLRHGLQFQMVHDTWYFN